MSRTEQPDQPDAWRAGLADLAADVERVARRLRGLSEPRLLRPVPGHPSAAAAGRALAQHLADTAAAAGAAAAGGGGVLRCVPEVRGPAVGDQVAVTGHDLLRVLGALTPDTPVHTASGSPTAAEVLAATRSLTREIKLAID